MIKDQFVQDYVSAVKKDIAECMLVLKTKRFVAIDEVARLQGHIEGCEAALASLDAIADRLDI